PRFVDPARADYRLRIGARGVNFSPQVTGVDGDLDLDMRPRDQALAIRAGFFGERDAGAYERQPSDPWLLNGEFDGDLNLWGSLTPTLTSYSALNGPGSSGGSVSFSRAATAGDPAPLAFNVLRQCFNVPGPGVYRLTAQGRAPGSVLASRDKPFAQLFVRNNSANCTGPTDQIVSTYLPNAAGFATLAIPLEVTVEAAQFNSDTTLEVLLNIEQDIGGTAMDAGFDKAVLTGTSLNDLIFADGFERP
ncbi:MAG: hypothetical protein ABI650_08725, partial [Dokdonella sp.]